MAQNVQVEEIAQSIVDMFFAAGARVSKQDYDAVRLTLTSLIASVSVEAEARLIEKVLKLVDEHDPNVGMGRDTSPAYWGNTLRKALQALTNHRV